jgi:hypothetical protein
MKRARVICAVISALLVASAGFGASGAFDRKAYISGVYAFVSYDAAGATNPRKVTLILCVDPSEPASGPNWFPFDPDVLYEIHVDNDNNARPDISFQFRFSSEQRLPNLFAAYSGSGSGVAAPANSPPPVPQGTPIVPPVVNSFSSPGLGTRQSYTVKVVRNGVVSELTAGSPMFAVPANPGPRTMDYPALYNAGIYSHSGGVKVFAGATDNPVFMDVGGLYDTFNLRTESGALTPAQDAALQNIASDTVSGYAVNSIAIEVPVTMLTRTGAAEPASSANATIGVWATTSRPRVTVRRSPLPGVSAGSFMQVERMGNPLVNDLLIGSAFQDRFSMDGPQNDAQFASFFLDPTPSRVLNALTNGTIRIPSPPRLDLLPLFQYLPPIAALNTPRGPVSDLLRLNTGVSATPPQTASRLGLLVNDLAGYPNGRRLFDDTTDIVLRLVVGGVWSSGFNLAPNNRLGDGVNVNDAPYRTSFPYLAGAPPGRSRRHIDPGEAGCTGGSGLPCAQE